MTAAASLPSTSQADATLAQWLEEERRVRQKVRPDYGIAKLSEIATLSGLEQLQGMLDGVLPPPPIAQTMEFTLLRVSRGEAVFQSAPKFRYYNPMGTVHGGWYATVLDSALGGAVHTTMDPGRGFTTLEIKVNLVRALDERVPVVRAVGRVRHLGRQLVTAEADLVGHDGKLYAHASTTCMAFDPPKR